MYTTIIILLICIFVYYNDCTKGKTELQLSHQRGFDKKTMKQMDSMPVVNILSSSLY